MCKEGIFERIKNGISIASDFYNKNKDDIRIAGVEERLEVLDSAYKEILNAESN